MSGENPVPDAKFQWRIQNPFLPFGVKVAMFYHVFTETKWKVIIQNHRSGEDEWPFEFTLKCNKIILTESVQVNISTNDYHGTLYSGEKRQYIFTTQNAFKVSRSCSFSECELTIAVKIIFAPQDNKYSFKDYRNYNLLDLKGLLNDLDELQYNSVYSDMRVKAGDVDYVHKVHSCVIKARWPNFFSKHHLYDQNLDRIIDTNISNYLLSDIIDYMYTGGVDAFRYFTQPDARYETRGRTITDAEYLTELFQVINFYEIDHLYRLFVNELNTQWRLNLRDIKNSDYDFSPPFGERSVYNWEDDLIGGNNIRGLIVFSLLPGSLNFYYTITIHCARTVHIRVQLRYQKLAGPPEMVHECDYEIPSSSTATSRVIRIKDSEICRLRGIHTQELSHRLESMIAGDLIKFYLNVRSYTGGEVLSIWSGNKTKVWKGMTDDWHRLQLLIEHIRYRSTPADLEVVCFQEPNLTTQRIHKAIFDIRVKKWRAVVRSCDNDAPIPEDEALPNKVKCVLESDENPISDLLFMSIRRYIYTGEMLILSDSESYTQLIEFV